MEKKSNHQVNIVRLGPPRVHTNADSLELFDIPNSGYQVVVKKGQFKAGELAVYVQPDSVVPQTEPFKFIWGDYVGLDGTVPDKRRRITVRAFRKEWSEGLLMPLAEVLPCNDRCVGWDYQEGTDVSDLLGITHYDPDAGRESTQADTANAPARRYPKTLRGWFWFILYKLGIAGRSARQNLALDVAFDYPVYDVEALKNFKNVLQPGEQVHVTEKIHGSNARFVFVEGTMYAGSRTQWKQKGSNVWWKAVEQHPEIEEWCRSYEGWVLYGEVCPTQGKNFSYGFSDGEVGFFAFDVLTPTGQWLWPGNTGFASTVPVVYVGAFDDTVLGLADGQTLVPNVKQLREGIVIRALDTRHVPRLGRAHLKVVSNAFLQKDSK